MLSQMRTAHFEMKKSSESEKLRGALFDMAHFQNMLLILIHKHGETVIPETKHKLRNLLLSPSLVRNFASGAPGGKDKEKLLYIEELLKDEDIFQNLKEHAKEKLKDKNVYKLVLKLKSAFKGFWTKKKDGDKTAQPPKSKKLAKFTKYAIAIDQCAYSFKKKDKVRINFNEKMSDFSLSHEKVLNLVGSFDKIQSLELIFRHEKIYLSVIYHKEIKDSESGPKSAGLDLGVKNLAGLFIADKTTPSLIISGSKMARFNHRNNLSIDKLKSKRDILLKKPEENLEALKDLKKTIAKLYEKRRKYFEDGMSKSASRICEYLKQCGVGKLYTSRDLGTAKQEIGLSKKFNKNFHPLPLIRLIEKIEYKAAEYGIENINVHEAYTSKCSCIHGDLKYLQETFEEKGFVSKDERRKGALNGERSKRSLFRDRITQKTYLADLNGAANHIIAGEKKGPMTWLSECIWKLANPIVENYDSLLLDLDLSKTSKLKDPKRSFIAAKFTKRFAFV